MIEIITDSSLLKKKCENVSLFDDVNGVIFNLEESLFNSLIPGVGLAAPQIGIYKNIAIVRYNNTRINLINAKILSKKEPFIFKNEGCLSFPDKKIKSLRFDKIEILNNNKKECYSGIVAVIICHELEHLDGITLEDKDLSKLSKKEKCPCDSGKSFKICHMREFLKT
jgi:peptide deformylase